MQYPVSRSPAPGGIQLAGNLPPGGGYDIAVVPPAQQSFGQAVASPLPQQNSAAPVPLAPAAGNNDQTCWQWCVKFCQDAGE